MKMSINYLYILIIILSFIQFNSKPSNNKITRKKLLFPKNSLKFLGNKEILISKENNKDIRFLDEEEDQQIDEDRDEVKDEEDKQKDELEKEELDKKENELKGDKKIDDDDDDDDENDVQDILNGRSKSKNPNKSKAEEKDNDDEEEEEEISKKGRRKKNIQKRVKMISRKK